MYILVQITPAVMQQISTIIQLVHAQTQILAYKLNVYF